MGCPLDSLETPGSCTQPGWLPLAVTAAFVLSPLLCTPWAILQHRPSMLRALLLPLYVLTILGGREILVHPSRLSFPLASSKTPAIRLSTQNVFDKYTCFFFFLRGEETPFLFPPAFLGKRSPAHTPSPSACPLAASSSRRRKGQGPSGLLSGPGSSWEAGLLLKVGVYAKLQSSDARPLLLDPLGCFRSHSLDLPWGKRLGHLFSLARPSVLLSKEAPVALGSPEGHLPRSSDPEGHALYWSLLASEW